jgi:hypothetical protein
MSSSKISSSNENYVIYDPEIKQQQARARGDIENMAVYARRMKIFLHHTFYTHRHPSNTKYTLTDKQNKERPITAHYTLQTSLTHTSTSSTQL